MKKKLTIIALIILVALIMALLFVVITKSGMLLKFFHPAPTIALKSGF